MVSANVMKPTAHRHILLLAFVLSWVASAGAQKAETGPLGGCPAGTYRFLVVGEGPVQEIRIRDGAIEILPGCQPTPVQLTAGERKTDVKAAWASCQGGRRKVELEGRIHGSFCDRFDGRLRVDRAKPVAIHAALVGCRAQYPDEAGRQAAIDRAVAAAASEMGGDPFRDAQQFAQLYYAVQAKLGCALDN